MSIQKLTVGKVYQMKRGGKHFLCIENYVHMQSRLVTLENGFSFIAQSTEIRPNGLISWITTVGGHRYGELDHELTEGKKFFPNGFPWEGKEINGGIDDDDY